MRPEPLLEVRGLVRRFGGLVALAGLDIEVDPGELVSLIGPNGAGKTTAFNLITGFLAPSEGSVRYDGQDVRRLPPHRRAAIGMVRTFQHASVFGDQTVRECLVTARHLRRSGGLLAELLGTGAGRAAAGEREDKARELAAFCRLERGFDEPAADLSYGEQKVLGIAMALAAEPRLLMLDEPTAGLNAVESRTIAELLDRINEEGLSVLLVEHDMDVVMGLSDRVVVLDHGARIAAGTPEEVRDDPDVVRAYLGDFELV